MRRQPGRSVVVSPQMRFITHRRRRPGFVGCPPHNPYFTGEGRAGAPPKIYIFRKTLKGATS